MKDEDIIEHLNDLMQLDHDAVETYERALEHVEDDLDVQDDLLVFKLDHERHITELSGAIIALGGKPKEPKRDVKGLLLEGLTALRSVTGTKGALKAMRMNEKITNKTYTRAVELDLPPAAKAIVAANLEDERRHLAAIETHIERLDAEAHDKEKRAAKEHRNVPM